MAQVLDPIPVSPPTAGVSKRASLLSLSDRWVDSDKVLFVAGKPQKMPGWLKKTATSVGNPIRELVWWATVALVGLYGFGTSRKLYVVDDGNEPNDITPIDTSGTFASNPFSTTVGSTAVTVRHTAHGRNVGDEVRFSGSSALGISGITPNGTFAVASFVDDDHYTVNGSVIAAATVTNAGGASVAYVYELPIGSDNPASGDGYGAGSYGLGTYGDPTEESSSVIFEPRVWSLAPYGDLLYVNPLERGIYKFDPNATPTYQRAAALTNAPTVCRSIFVTPERFLFALGVNNDPLNIKWPDQDDHTNWTPGSTSTANSRRLTQGTRIVAGTGLASFISAVWTDTSLYRFQYTGNQFIYDSAPVGKNCGLVSPMAFVVHLGIAYWMSKHGFHFWGGGGAPHAIPNSEDVTEYVIRALRQSGYEYKCSAVYSPRYNALFFFYVVTGSAEPGLYVAVSLSDYSWVVGTMERTAGTIGPDQRPVLAGVDGYLYQHEEGLDADGAVMSARIERAPLQVANGARLGEVRGLVPDMERQTGAMSVEVKTYDRINDGVLDTEQSFFEPGENLVDIGIGGRIARITFRCEELGGDFRLGNPMLEVLATGKRR